MKKELFELTKLIGFVFVHYLGDVIVRSVTGKDEFPKYYWICTGLVLLYQIIRDLDEIKKSNRGDRNEKEAN